MTQFGYLLLLKRLLGTYVSDNNQMMKSLCSGQGNRFPKGVKLLEGMVLRAGMVHAGTRRGSDFAKI